MVAKALFPANYPQNYHNFLVNRLKLKNHKTRLSDKKGRLNGCNGEVEDFSGGSDTL